MKLNIKYLPCLRASSVPNKTSDLVAIVSQPFPLSATRRKPEWRPHFPRVSIAKFDSRLSIRRLLGVDNENMLFGRYRKSRRRGGNDWPKFARRKAQSRKHARDSSELFLLYLWTNSGEYRETDFLSPGHCYLASICRIRKFTRTSLRYQHVYARVSTCKHLCMYIELQYSVRLTRIVRFV